MKLNITTEMTHAAATKAAVNAGADHKDQNVIVAIIDQSRVKQEVLQTHTLTYIGEMWAEGRRVTDVEIAPRNFRPIS